MDENSIKILADTIVRGLLRPNQVIIPDDIDFVIKALKSAVKIERNCCITAVSDEANRLGFSCSDEYYRGYKSAIANALAAIRKTGANG
jgi:hypothetical protein